MTLKEKIRKYFGRKAATQTPQHKGQGVEPVPLRIEGTNPAPLTPEPDDAELAATALLESMAEVSSSKFQVSSNEAAANLKPETCQPETRDAAYYYALADRIRAARDDSRRRTLRFVAWAEGQLALPSLPVTGPGSLQLIERELLKRVDFIEQMGDRLKQRWQHALAVVTVRLMQADGRVEEKRKNEEADAALIRQPDISSTSQPEVRS